MSSTYHAIYFLLVFLPCTKVHSNNQRREEAQLCIGHQSQGYRLLENSYLIIESWESKALHCSSQMKSSSGESTRVVEEYRAQTNSSTAKQCAYIF